MAIRTIGYDADEKYRSNCYYYYYDFVVVVFAASAALAVAEVQVLDPNGYSVYFLVFL